MDLFWPLVLIRWLHIGVLIVLFGSSLFALYELNSRRDDARSDIAHHLALAILALTSGLVWVALVHADLTESLESVWSASAWRVFLLQTNLGTVWIVRLGLLTALVLVALLTRSAAPPAHAVSLAGVSAALLCSLAWLGHAAAGHGGYAVGIAVYVAHVLAAAAWLGGLVPLFRRIRWATRQPEGMAVVAVTLARFSRVGIIAVVAIAGSGLINTSLRSVTFLDLVSTTYGKILLLKMILFAIVLGLAATNRWRYLALLDRKAVGSSVARALYRSVAAEQLLGASIVAMAVFLASMSPIE